MPGTLFVVAANPATSEDIWRPGAARAARGVPVIAAGVRVESVPAERRHRALAGSGLRSNTFVLGFTDWSKDEMSGCSGE
jgi:hypothetical protein